MLESPSPPPPPAPGALPPVRLAAALAGLLVATAVMAGAGFRLSGVRLGGVDLPLVPDPTPRAVAMASPVVDLGFRGLPLAGMSLEVDARPVPLETRWLAGRAQARPGPLAEGRHELCLRTGEARSTWTFVVDTRPPAGRVDSPRPGARLAGRSVRVRGRAEPGTRVSVRAGDRKVEAPVPAGGGFQLEVPLHPGRNPLHWEVRDAAGNATTGALEVSCDQTPPRLDLQDPADGSWVSTASPTLVLSASDPESGLESLQLRVDGGAVRSLPVPEAGRPVRVQLDPLAEGLRALELSARNRVGLVTRKRITLGVDSTETLGQAVLTLGARGRDVEELQDRLHDEGFLRGGDPAGHFGEATREAVRAFQKEVGLKPDGLVGPYTVGALRTRIYVNLARFSLVLVDREGRVREWPVAHGAPGFETPVGSFHVADLARDPTWIPPDSPWAREAEATPPGPGNPLGTRWIGLSSGVVGIHGTPAAGSIGTRASHGCIRMTIPDVEELFERVEPGTRVRILAGTEDDPVLRRFWPQAAPARP